MAYQSTDTTAAISFAGEIKSAFGRVFSRLGRAIDTFAQHRSRGDEIMRLNAMSDEQLAKRGLTRETIVQHVFRDMYYL